VLFQAAYPDRADNYVVGPNIARPVVSKQEWQDENLLVRGIQ